MLRLIGLVVVLVALAIVYALRPKGGVPSGLLNSFTKANGIPLIVTVLLAVGTGLMIGLH